MMKAPLLAALASAAIIASIALLFAGWPAVPAANAVPGEVTRLAVDVDTTGNDDSTVGTIQNCRELAVNDTIDIDLVVQGVDPADKIHGYQVDIDYDPTVISVLNVVDADTRGSVAPNDVTMVSRINSTGGTGFLSLTDISTNPNSITVSAIDGTSDAYFTVAGVQAPPLMHEPGDIANGIDDDGDTVVDNASEASQDGVLARITIQALATGTTLLNVPGPSGGADTFPDQKIIAGTGPLVDDSIPITIIDIAAISVGEACVPPTVTPDVRITALDCSSNPEVVTIENVGTATQDLTGWTLTSEEPADTPPFNLFENINFETGDAGTLLAGASVRVYSDSAAPLLNVAAGTYPWPPLPPAEKFRNFDTTDFAQILDGQSAVVSTMSCAAATPTPTPTPQVTQTATATATPTPQGGAGNLPPTGDGISTGGGSTLAWALVALGAVITLGATGYVLYGRRKRRLIQ